MHERRLTLALVALLVLVVASPLVANDVEATEGRGGAFVTLTYTGNASSVELNGEWNWSAPVAMTQNGNVWSVDVELEEGLYCYKFVVDGAYILTQATRSESTATTLRIHSSVWTTIFVRTTPPP
mgnify:CR=1 FL=1